MRVNIYTQELTNEFQIVEKTGEDGSTYTALLLLLHSSPHLHQPPEHVGKNDDRSGVAIWLPKSKERRENFALTLERMATAVRMARDE